MSGEETTQAARDARMRMESAKARARSRFASRPDFLAGFLAGMLEADDALAVAVGDPPRERAVVDEIDAGGRRGRGYVEIKEPPPEDDER